MGNPTPPSGTTKTVLGAILVALIAGSSSPWWYEKMFPKSPPPSSPVVTTQSPPAQVAPTTDPVPPVSHLVMSALEYDKNYVGQDLDAHGKPAASAADCSELCMNDDRCHAMTYIKSQQICWLKHSSDGGSTQTTDMISAVKQAK